MRGRRQPLVGTVSMDNVTIDLGPETEVEPGDEAVLIGSPGRGDDPRRGGRRPARHDQLRGHLRDLGPGAAPAPCMSARRPSPRRRRWSPPARRGAAARRRDVWIVGGAVRDAALGREVDRPRPRGRRRSRRGGAGDRARSCGEHAFELSAEFGTWRVVSAEQRLADRRRRALRGEAIEADLAERDFTDRRRRRAARRRRADRSHSAVSPTSSAASCGSSASAASEPTRCGCCAPPVSPPSWAWRSTRRPSRSPAPQASRAAEPGRRAAAGRAAPAGRRPGPVARPCAARRARAHRGGPARAGGAARRRTGSQPPPRRPRPHAGGPGAHAGGRGRPRPFRRRPRRRGGGAAGGAARRRDEPCHGTALRRPLPRHRQARDPRRAAGLHRLSRPRQRRRGDHRRDLPRACAPAAGSPRTYRG